MVGTVPQRAVERLVFGVVVRLVSVVEAVVELVFVLVGV